MGRRNRVKPQKAHDTNIPTDAAVGQKRDRVNDSDTTDNTNTSRPLKNKKDVWKVDFRYPGDQRNVMLEEYYKMQVFFNKDHPFHQQQHSACPVKVEDWGACYETLKQPLPMAYRINSAHPDRDSVRALLEKEMYNAGFLTQGSQVIDDMITTNGSDNGSGIPCSATIQSPTPCKGTALDENDTVSGVVVTLEYVPNRLAFQADLSRGELKRLPAFKHLKRVVAALNDAGMLTRQEAVSMIPPLLLDVRPGMSVLDMCAAPGSKTSQLLEAMVSGEYRARPSRPKSEGMVCLAYDDNNEGCVVANDVNISRIDILTHQTNRAPSAHPFLVITNNDATTFPLFRNNEDKFDRVLCDVMCSGDGTLRKSADLWTRWNPLQGASLHQAQLQTLLRGMSLVKKGGIVVYSTCSMNPVEDEAVIASALLESGGAFELIDKDEMPDNKGNDDDCMMYGKEECNGILNGLRYSKGIVDWSLMNRDGTLVFDTFADAMSHRQEVMKGKGFQYYSTMFPPHKRDLPPKATSPNSSTSTTVDTTATTTTMPNISKQVINNENYHTDPLHLSRCIRVLPHQQNTGGFFIAALRCIRDYNVEDNAKKRAKSKHERAIAINKAAEVPRVNTDAHDAEAIVHKEEVVGGRDVSHDHTANNNNNTHAYDKPPLFMAIPKILKDSLVSSLSVIDSANGSLAGCLPFHRIYVRSENYKDTLAEKEQGSNNNNDSNDITEITGNNDTNEFPALEAEAPPNVTEVKAPRNVKLYLAAPGVASMVMHKLDPSRVNVMQMGAKIVESYVKYSHDKLRFHLDGLRTILPYLLGLANTDADGCAPDEPSKGQVNNKLFALKCDDTRWIVNCLIRGVSGGTSSVSDRTDNTNGGNSPALPSIISNCKALVPVSELAARCCALSGCPSSELAEIPFTPRGCGVGDAIDKEEKVSVFRQVMANRSLVLVCTLASLGLSQPVYISVELDSTRTMGEVIAQPHQLVLLMLSLGDDLGVFTGGEGKAS